MKQAFLNKGEIVTHDVPIPSVKQGYVLVRTEYSCISSGTEMSGVAESGTSLIQKAISKPKKVIDMLKIARSRGLNAMINIITSARGSNFGNQIGYTAAGTVIDSRAKNTQYTIGDRVAVIGTGYANHAEYNCVPENLVIRIPDNVSFQDAATAALGGIAMQGVRQLAPLAGDYVVVMGLGLIGQITVQILLAQGCRVVGIDINNERLSMAMMNDYGIKTLNGNDSMLVHKVMMLTGGHGVDGVIFTANTSSSVPLANCFHMLRKKGSLVLVGVSGMNINRADIYSKELTFKIATSYGPGRYDTEYEENGIDYPREYVRFTEQRNVVSYFELLSRGKVKLSHLSSQICKVDNANEAFERLKGKYPPLVSLLDYTDHLPKQISNSKSRQNSTKISNGIISIGFIGTGDYVKTMHLPLLSTMSGKYRIKALMNRSAVPAAALAAQYQTAYYTTDYQELLNDTDINLIAVCTRHDTHAQYAIAAMQAGKDVFVEKPPALNESELNELLQTVHETGRNFLVGYNRRFSKYALEIKRGLEGRNTPVHIEYTMNAGFVPYNIWMHSDVGGGRIIGEGCHIIDLFIYLIGKDVKEIIARPIYFKTGYYRSKDNISCTIIFTDGSSATLNYISIGAKTMPKETMRLICGNKIYELDDYRSLYFCGKEIRRLRSMQPDKGQKRILEILYESEQSKTFYPISLKDIETTSKITFEIARQISVDSM